MPPVSPISLLNFGFLAILKLNLLPLNISADALEIRSSSSAFQGESHPGGYPIPQSEEINGFLSGNSNQAVTVPIHITNLPGTTRVETELTFPDSGLDTDWKSGVES